MKTVNLIVLLSLMIALMFANPLEPGKQLKMIDLPQGTRMAPQRTVPEYSFTRLPVSILTSYYDYMIGGYNGLPLQVVPPAFGGGYFLTFHGKRTPTALRRIFYCYIDAQGNLVNNVEIGPYYIQEGYPTLAVDQVSGKPLYAWHSNTDTDAELEVMFTSDAFLSGIAGLFNDNQIIVNNPITITAPNGTTTSNNEFIWPTAVIGPSPIANKRRVYVACRNSVSSTYGPSENVYIAYADFNADDIEYGNPLVWNHTSVPELNNWNVDTQWRRPFLAVTADNAGNVYLAGYHLAFQADGVTEIVEPELDVFHCPNYGQGTWSRVSSFSDLPTWNPPAVPGGTSGYFVDEDDIPYLDSELSWKIINSSHLNASVDHTGKIHSLAVWGLSTVDGSYYPAYQFVKELVFDPANLSIAVNDVFPQKDPNDNYNQHFTPWDNEAPWGVAEYVQVDGVWQPDAVTDWPFPHWDTSAHSDAMLFHYNNTKITHANSEGMMAAVWQNSQRARWYNYYSDTDYYQFATTPEICISVSSDNGISWSEPIVLNNVETLQLSGLKPMWVYPADRVIYTGMQGNNKVGKLGLMFYNDYTWGSNSVSPPYHPTNDGGQVMFMELQIVFPLDTTLPTVALPAFSPPGGNYQDPQTVTISCDTPGAQIRYTLDGSEPNINSTLYSEPLYIGLTTTLKAKGYLTDWNPSQAATAIYTITGTTVETPVFSPDGGVYFESVTVSIVCATPGAEIRYTFDGSDPTTTSTLYAGPLQFTQTTVIKARGFFTGWTPSAVSSEIYTIIGTVQTPVFSPPPGTYATAQYVSLSCDTPESQIRFTTDGSDPTATSPLYSYPLYVSGSTTFKARAYRSGWNPSEIVTAEYEITLSNPDEPIPVVTGIHNVYPNPFLSSTTIALGLKEPNQGYQLRIYNLKGECVFEKDGIAKGWFDVSWNGRDLNGNRVASGIYLVSFVTGKHRSARKVVLL